MTYTPDTLRTLAAKYWPSKPLGTLMPELQADLDACADAWEAEQNEDIRRHEEWLNERNGLLERLEAVTGRLGGWKKAAKDWRNQLIDANKRLEAAEKLAGFAQHLPGCMEPGLVDEDCACGYWEAKQAALAAGDA